MTSSKSLRFYQYENAAVSSAKVATMCRFSDFLGVSIAELHSDQSSTDKIKQTWSADRAKTRRDNGAYLKPGRQKQADKLKSGNG